MRTGALRRVDLSRRLDTSVRKHAPRHEASFASIAASSHRSAEALALTPPCNIPIA